MVAVPLVLLLSTTLCAGGFSQNVEVEDCPATNEENVFIKVYDDTCYYFHLKEKTTFEGAHNACLSQGRYMIQPRSQEANGYLCFFIIHLQKSDRVWFGALRDILASGSPKYFWKSGDEIPSSLVGSIERYGVPHTVPRSNGVWHFDLADKSETHPFVCELRVDKKTTTTTTPAPTPPPPTPPPPTTTTTRTATTTQTPTTLKSHVVHVQSLVEQLCPHLLNTNQYMKLFGPYCFYFQLKSKETYSRAKEICEKDGGTLAILNTDLRDHFIGFHQKNSFGSPDVWIGLRPEYKPQTHYLWDDGSPFEYSNMGSTITGPGNAIIKFGDHGKWFTALESLKFHYVCQFRRANILS